ncbi:lactate utilization protein [Phototrophicus methaneseepsis]|uniref:Lactate utilization protein n=1 Tax=Phototrophicus methaneseepsis TaxID=2710758 RepID=A0A7S8IDA9_9CHLR|nr:lactate utilization protein [Phototrophicus methaneseepsis]QPC81372.1 lactate utilization protein [Phototrophicus methaneseepsis]
MSSRDHIFSKLRSAQKPFTEVPPIEQWRHMVPQAAQMSPAELQVLFMQELDLLGCTVYCPPDDEDAIAHILEMLEGDEKVLSWEETYLPLGGLHDALAANGVTVAAYNDGNVRVGVTGVAAALAATGSLLLSSGEGRYRLTSLLPDLHIAVVDAAQIVADFETWIAQQKAAGLPAFHDASNTFLITGPSKTADIAQILIKGAHGPRKVHVVLMNSSVRTT